MDMSPRPPHALLTRVDMARNHVPHTATGIPPPLSTAGRYDLLGGHADAAWNHDPGPLGPAVRQANSMRNILNARNAIIKADAKSAIVACANRNLCERSHEFTHAGSPVRIALRGERVGSCSVFGRSPSNVIFAKRRTAFKWPKYKARLPHLTARRMFGAGRDSIVARKRRRNRYC